MLIRAGLPPKIYLTLLKVSLTHKKNLKYGVTNMIVKQVKDATIDEIKSFFESEKKDVVTFVGYSGSEYEDKAAMLEKAGRILDEFDSSRMIVNIGATPEGIGAVYELAKRRGFITTGIVSTQAKEYNAELSPCVDYVFYVEDATWGGFIEGGDRLSPTSTAMVKNSDMLIGIGGGEVARDELMAAILSGKEVRFIPAEPMNHQSKNSSSDSGRSPLAQKTEDKLKTLPEGELDYMYDRDKIRVGRAESSL